MSKVCSKCGANVPNDSQFCTNCGSSEFKTIETPAQPAVAPVVAPTVAPAQPAVATQPPKKGMPTWLKVILIILLVLVLLVGGCTAGCVILTKNAVDSVNEELENWESELDDWESEYDYSDDYDTDTEEDNSTDSVVKTLGDTFTFDGFEITLGEEITYSTVENQFSEHNGKTAIRVSATITNNNTETSSLSSLDYKFYGSLGTELDSVGYYFDDSVEYAGDLRTGASYEKAFYLLYDANGTYAIEFDDWFDQQVTVEFDVTK